MPVALRRASMYLNPVLPGEAVVDPQAIEQQILSGDVAGALGALQRRESDPALGSSQLAELVLLYTRLGRFEHAFRCAERQLESSPSDLSARYTWANAAIAVGRLDQAEKHLDQIAAESPGQTEVYYTRSSLRRQAENDNHVDELLNLREAWTGDEHDVPISYALGKEYEDLGRYEEAFTAFARGASSRRRRLSYDVGSDVETLSAIAETFDRDWWEATAEGAPESGPLFVLGLPRSGTTLVDRILSSHLDVASLGEIDDFTYAVMRAGGGARDKQSLMQNLAGADMAELGVQYLTASQGYGEDEAFLINKTPGNYLYLGLIAKALPGARFVHLQRHPVASCYAMFKTLFRMGYPFSYSLDDLADYWLAYDRLMSHWRSLLGERLLDVSYEGLVDEQESVSRQIVAHCGLDWSDDCLSFHRNTAPTATASAAQVRSPIYRSARDLWRHYEAQLEPLVVRLRQGGAKV